MKIDLIKKKVVNAHSVQFMTEATSMVITNTLVIYLICYYNYHCKTRGAQIVQMLVTIQGAVSTLGAPYIPLHSGRDQMSNMFQWSCKIELRCK